MAKRKFNIYRVVRRVFVRRKYKDFLFQRVFRDKKDILDLYNALNGTNYNNPDDIEITTLEDAIYLSFKNDLSFIIASSLNLYEHQSTVNVNMPLRALIYFAKEYQAYVAVHKLNIYDRKRIKLPTPQCVVLYNGRENIVDNGILKLTDSFTTDASLEPMLECKVRVININYGHNEELLNSCKRLHDYSFFINRINENQDAGLGLEESISSAIDYCIEEHILEDILLKNREEVHDMLLTKYDRKLHEKTIRQEGWEDGREIGYSEGFNSRQGEIDELKTLMLFKDSEAEKMEKESKKKEEELQLSNQRLSEAEKRIAELESLINN